MSTHARSDHSAFLGIALGSQEKAWGCISLESRSAGQYDEKAKDVLSTLRDLLQIHIERIRLLRKFEDLNKNSMSSLSV